MGVVVVVVVVTVLLISVCGVFLSTGDDAGEVSVGSSS